MESTRFDALTRRLAAPTSRRALMRAGAAAAVANMLALVGGRQAGAEASCVTFCQQARSDVHDACMHAGGGTVAAFACPPQGNASGFCASAAACATTSQSPAGQPADAALCQEARQSCEVMCGGATRTSFGCNPARREWVCACVG